MTEAVKSPCCRMRLKVELVPVFLPEERCGVSSSEVADFVIWDEKSPQGKAVASFRFCPWCGVPWKRSGVYVETTAPPEPGEEWKS